MQVVTLRDVEYDPATGDILATWEGSYHVPEDGSLGTVEEVAAALRASRGALIRLRGREVLELAKPFDEKLPDALALRVSGGKLVAKL